MNQNGARRAIVSLIDGYKDILVDGFVHQGQVRTIDGVYKSVMTAPMGFYYIMVQVDNSATTSFPGGSVREARPHRMGLYSMTVHVVDIATMESGNEPYEVVDEDFRELCDRIECMLLGTYHAGFGQYGSYFTALPVCIPDPESESKFRLPRGTNDREVRVINLDHTWEDPDSDTYVPILYSQIKFQLEEEWER